MMDATSPEELPVVAILGDSRTFDTYYVNDRYVAPYGYDRTFPSLWRARQLRADRPAYDVIHIPDHFRGGTVENNIIRLALCHPQAIVLCDGIWESLLSKKLFIEFLNNEVGNFNTSTGAVLNLTYSSRAMADLFLSNRLSMSPYSYAERIGRITGYFLRRNCQVYWMNLCIPGHDHFDRLHFAGNYLCAPEWSECLAALNEATTKTVQDLGGAIFDTDAAMHGNGGPSNALIDQWHYSAGFHAALATNLADTVGASLVNGGRKTTGRTMFRAELQGLNVATVGISFQDTSTPAGGEVSVVYPDDDSVPAHPPTVDCIIFHTNDPRREYKAANLRRRWPGSPVVLFSDELHGIENPMPGGRDDGRRQT